MVLPKLQSRGLELLQKHFNKVQQKIFSKLIFVSFHIKQLFQIKVEITGRQIEFELATIM